MFYDVKDDFLSAEYFSELTKQTIYNPYFPLYMKHGVGFPNGKDGNFFVHSFYNKEHGVVSEYYDLIKALVDLLNPSFIDRIQLNIYPRTESNWRYDWHIDKPEPHKGCIVYLNTNDGMTLLNPDHVVGIRSIANRALLFEPHKEHCATSCTDQNFRSNIIINYG